MLADDDPDDRLIIREAIKDFSGSIVISEVANGRELIDFVASKSDGENRPDVIILDINMPLMDGVDALKELKNAGLANDIAIYILSTMRNRERVKEAQELGVAGTISKPHTMKGFQQVVHEIITNSLS